MEQFVAQGQTSAPAAATPARGEGSGQSFEQRVAELEATVAALKDTNKELGESTFIDQEQPKTAHDPGTPKRGPQAGSNPFSYAQFTVQPRGSVQYPTSSQ